MNGYQDRLRNEIERIGVTNLSKKLGISRNTLYNWAERSNVPLDKLMAMGENGLNVDYVIFGNETAQFSEQDKKIVETFHKLSPENQNTAIKVLDGLTFVNHGYVNQVNFH